jgi:hypothetical protein
VALIVAAAAVGVVAWNGHVLALPLACAFPALWAFAPSRKVSAMVSAGYFLAASRGLPQGVVNFYGSDVNLGIALWVGAAAAFVLVHALLWQRQPGMGRAAKFTLAAVLMSVPPFGIVGWAQPVTAAGILFPGWGWWGLAATAAILLAMTVGACFWAWSAAHWISPPPPDGWAGLDTQFGSAPDLDQTSALLRRVRAAGIAGARIVVLPESVAGLWTPTKSLLWIEALHDAGVTAIVGAAIVNREGYDNVMVEIGDGRARALYSQRMPVPLSMWQPWLAWTGKGGGASASFFGNPVVEADGRRVTALICYEQLLVWPVLQSMWERPDVVVAIGNDWWTSGTSILAIQQASTRAWVSLFGLPLVLAFNT